MIAKKKPTGFVATCQCGVIVGAMDYTRTDRKDAGQMLGKWLHDGCTVEPRFAGTWNVTVEPCRCEPSNAAIEALRSALAQQGEPAQQEPQLLTETEIVHVKHLQCACGRCYSLPPLRPAPQPVVKTPPEWWPAVENILTEYGLDAISFVADFKKASGDYPAQIKQDISAPQAQQLTVISSYTSDLDAVRRKESPRINFLEATPCLDRLGSAE